MDSLKQMEEKILKAFRIKETLSVCALALELQIEEDRLITILETLINQGKVKVKKGRFCRADRIRWEGAFFL